MKRTFFEYIGIADIEKIHSQILQWILSKDNKSLNSNQKNKLIEILFEIKDFKITEIITEYENIDILIKSTTNKVICIENKIKSSQHSNQLEKYKKSINNKYGETKSYFFFLTLINENSFDKDWKNINYNKLLSSLLLFKDEIEENTDGLILLEYIQTLENFNSIINDFLKNPNEFINVFTDGRKTKKQKKTENKHGKQKFISDNQLETIFQKMYFKKVAEKLKLKNYYIVETHGNAILGVKIKSNILLNGKFFDFGFDYQNGTFKTMCISSDYENSNLKDIPPKIPELFEKIKNEGKYGYEKVNKPKTKAQYSLTKRRRENIGINIDKFANNFENELKISRELIENEIIKTIANKDEK